jgi:putative ABC transport system substrate-binding protein
MSLRRRDFIILQGGATAAWPPAARAQQPAALPVIGYLDAGLPEANVETLAAMRRGLSEAGYAEGRNVAIEYRWAQSEGIDRVRELATDLVRRRVAVIVTAQTQGALAAKAATTTIPIVFWASADAVAAGLVESLSRPGGNLTGVNSLNVESYAQPSS